MDKQAKKDIEDRLAEIAERTGILRPEDVIADAADSDSPLHAQFEWDDTKAAQAHRLDQARMLIRSVRVVIHTETTSVSAVNYLRDPRADAKDQGYVSMARLRTDADLARDAIVNEFSRAAAVLRRAREIAIALDMTAPVDDVITRVESLTQQARAPA